jgi:glycerophosphoryl diester phosphodiesterase
VVSGEQQENLVTQIYAHRGRSGAYPENTLLAFEKALALGVDGIELDVHATADGVPVVIHDRAVERTTNGSGHVDEIPLRLLETFDAGRGERVPTLASVLDLVGDRVHLDVEVKGVAIERDVFEVLTMFPTVRWAISSFDWRTLRNVRELDPAAELWPLATQADAELLSIADELGSPAVALFAGAYDADGSRLLHRAGLDVMVWTVNDAREARRVRDLGARALCTDVPERVLAAFGRL